jgi:hypothetical protein
MKAVVRGGPGVGGGHSSEPGGAGPFCADRRLAARALPDKIYTRGGRKKGEPGLLFLPSCRAAHHRAPKQPRASSQELFLFFCV